MAERSRCTTRALIADEAFCRQVARLLFANVEPISRAFLGEPVKEVLALVDWALAHEEDPGFEAGRALEAWARRRSRGAYRPQEQPTNKAPSALDNTTARRGDKVDSESLRGILADPERLAKVAEKMGV